MMTEIAGGNLVRHDKIDFVSLTGGRIAGRDVAEQCAKKLRSYSLELSGNDAAIVTSDANLEFVTNGLTWGAFCNAGQVCVGVKRAYIVDEVYDALAHKIKSGDEELVLGRDVGSIIDEAQLNAVEEFVEDLVCEGARVLCGGKRASEGLFYAPTVLEVGGGWFGFRKSALVRFSR